MRSLKLLGTTAAAGFAVALLGAPAQAAPAAKSTPITIQGKSAIHCGKGYGGNKTVTFSWKQATYSTTFYFNDHCTKGKLITAAVVTRHNFSGHWKYLCIPLDTHGQTHGKKKFEPRYKVWQVLRGHSNKYCKVK
ncbi:hypothetical protein [Actinoallomurus sp. NPDC050550]|uniref:hypothetical protein n=1 Tax=Actinoallomurus sp. NPDC050550 TaxID=3154937 RepID=UPI0033C842F3